MKHHRSQSATLGFRAHSGWSAVVALGGSATAPSVLKRGRITMCDDGQQQPYHAAAEMKLADAETFIEECAETALVMASRSIAEVVAAIGAKGYSVKGACVLLSSGRPLPALEKILAAHPLIHTAEGEFFRNAVRKGCESCGLKVRAIREREVASDDPLIAELGKLVGPPWRQDEKLCAAAALAML